MVTEPATGEAREANQQASIHRENMSADISLIMAKESLNSNLSVSNTQQRELFISTSQPITAATGQLREVTHQASVSRNNISADLPKFNAHAALIPILYDPDECRQDLSTDFSQFITATGQTREAIQQASNHRENLSADTTQSYARAAATPTLSGSDLEKLKH